MQGSVGNWLIVIGATLIVFGIIAKFGLVGWFGQLPGDLHIKRDNFQFYFPLASMVVISVVLSLLISLLRRFM